MKWLALALTVCTWPAGIYYTIRTSCRGGGGACVIGLIYIIHLLEGSYTGISVLLACFSILSIVQTTSCMALVQKRRGLRFKCMQLAKDMGPQAVAIQRHAIGLSRCVDDIWSTGCTLLITFGYIEIGNLIYAQAFGHIDFIMTLCMNGAIGCMTPAITGAYLASQRIRNQASRTARVLHSVSCRRKRVLLLTREFAARMKLERAIECLESPYFALMINRETPLTSEALAVFTMEVASNTILIYQLRSGMIK